MARPIKDNADYFSHDASMRDDAKIKALRRKFKHEGYSIWNMLLESITDSDNFRFHIDYEITAGDYDIEPEKLRDIVEYCVKLGLLQTNINDTVIWSNTLDKRMFPLLSKRKRDRNPADSELSTAINPHSKVKESKGELITHGEGKLFITIAKRYAHEKQQKIYDLEAYFTSTGQIQTLKESGWIFYQQFITENSGKQFNEPGHLDNAFRNFCKDYTPPARAPNKYENAEYNKTLWTLEAWEEFYNHKLLADPEFRKHFGYGELFVSKSVGG